VAETIEIKTLRALKDNYCYLIRRPGSKKAVIVDPSETTPIADALRESGTELGLILNTHHHHDHVGGNLELQTRWKCPVYCSAYDLSRVPGATRGFSDEEHFEFDGLKFEVLAIPGHTNGQIAFSIEDALFVGDTVFEMGCGRLYEGTALQMFDSFSRIRSLPPATRLFFGHEYTETNARFAKMVEPGNHDVDQRLSQVRLELTQYHHAVAPTIETEIKVNPFFRALTPESFAQLRELRNTFQ
jgi:hydroxyacylglutathione hydrolase